VTPAELIDQLILRWGASVSSEQRVYAYGVKEKWLQVAHAIEEISRLNIAYSGTYSMTGTASQQTPTLDAEAEIRFYFDAFWTFLYSLLDIAAELINARMGAGLSEQNCDFLALTNHLNQTQSNTSTQLRMNQLKASGDFEILNHFRNCATHRRPVYIEVITQNVKGTPGYGTATSAIQSTVRYVCDDPLAIHPTVIKRRELVGFCFGIVYRLARRVDGILRTLN
jgi:hypothetical protein